MSELRKKPYDVYISYHKEQTDVVQKLYKQMRDYGMRIWLDQYSKKGANSFDDSISGITSSNLFMCFESVEFKNSIKCRVELGIAIEQKLPIVNVIAENQAENPRDYLFSQLKTYANYLRVDLTTEPDIFNKGSHERLNELLQEIYNKSLHNVKKS